MRATLLLAVALLLAGCAGPGPESLKRADSLREPHYEEHRDLVAPQHNKTYPVAVGAEATLVNATLHLVPRTNGLTVPDAPTVPGRPAPAAAPTHLKLDVLDATGRPVAGAVVDPANPSISLLVEEIAAPGDWVVRVSGSGASGTIDGQDYGASYLLTIEVLYGQ